MKIDNEENELEWAYWRFDALVNGHAVDLIKVGLGPMEERTAFKSAVREMLAKLEASYAAKR